MKRDAWRQGSPEEQARSPGADEKHRGSRWEQSVRWLLPRASAAKLAIARLTLLWHGRHGTKGRGVTAEPGVQSYYDQVRTLRPCNP